MAGRRLIVNADDLGCSIDTTTGILRTFTDGILTSASLMVRPAAAGDAVDRAAAVGLDDLGLHLDLGEWSLRAGHWEPVYEVVPRDDARLVEEECARQLERFERLTGRPPTHLDSHQHVHLHEPVRGVAVALARRLGIPLRHLSRRVTHRGKFYGQKGDGTPLPGQITAAGLLEWLREETATVVEMGCHPGLDRHLPTMYRDERLAEVATLCQPGLAAAIQEIGFSLGRFTDLPPEGSPPETGP